MMDEQQAAKVVTRLKRIRGQVGGIQRMVEDERYCVDVLVQIASVRSAMSKVAQILLESHVDTCVADAIENGSRKQRKDKLDELFDVLGRFGKL